MRTKPNGRSVTQFSACTLTSSIVHNRFFSSHTRITLFLSIHIDTIDITFLEHYVCNLKCGVAQALSVSRYKEICLVLRVVREKHDP